MAAKVEAKKPGALTRLAARATEGTATAEREVLIPLDKIRFDPKQPRTAFHPLDGRVSEKDENYIKELSGSIAHSGLIQAITVQEMADGSYLVVVGECRTRAHLLLGRSTIRAIVRNDLKSPALRLIYQLAENVNRQDLTDGELAVSIRLLMEGSEADGIAKMNQAEVAAYLGKSEGWVTRYVKFGDEETKRVWFDSGIADTVEKVYRLSILPPPVQMEVVRRASLPEGDPERLEKPLNRSVIDELALEAKREKLRGQQAPATPANEPGRDPHTVDLESGKTDAEQHGASSIPPGDTSPTGTSAQPDPIAQALAESATAGQAGVAGGSNSNVGTSATQSSGYQLPATARTEILGGAAAVVGAGASRQAVQAPINCKVSLANLAALLEALADDDGLLNSAMGLRCELSIPGEFAKQLANRLVGVIVSDQELPATVQQELSKLG